ncbi:hypothetical protein B0T17DRAFT_23865, partial [Bombardia bombarda]
VAALVEEPVAVAALKKSAKPPKASPKTEKRKASEDASNASPIATKKSRPSKDTAASKKKKVAVVAEVEEPAAISPEPSPAPKAAAAKKSKATKKTKAVVEEKQPSPEPVKEASPEPIVEDEVAEEEAEDEEKEEELDDETLRFIEKFGSDDEDEGAGTYEEGQDVGKIPKAKKSKQVAAPSTKGKPGVMYLGSIPHGFFEHQIRSYFTQFGEITKLRVVRNKKTGASRHRAFVEFAEAEVADIAARTMDKYLLFGRLLKAQVVPPAQVHPNLFKGCNRRFKAVPWNKMAGKQLERPLSESKWQVKITKEEQRRAARAEKLKEIGYEFESPALKIAEAKEQAVIEAEEPVKAIEEAPAQPEVVTAEVTETEVTVEDAEKVTTISQKKTKVVKTKKAKKVKV